MSVGSCFLGHWNRSGSERDQKGGICLDFGGLERRISSGRALEGERSRGGVFDQESRTGSLSLVFRVLFPGQKEGKEEDQGHKQEWDEMRCVC